MQVHKTLQEIDARLVEGVDRGRGEGHRNAGRDLEQIPPELRRIIGGPASRQHDKLGPPSIAFPPELLNVPRLKPVRRSSVSYALLSSPVAAELA